MRLAVGVVRLSQAHLVSMTYLIFITPFTGKPSEL